MPEGLVDSFILSSPTIRCLLTMVAWDPRLKDTARQQTLPACIQVRAEPVSGFPETQPFGSLQPGNTVQRGQGLGQGHRPSSLRPRSGRGGGCLRSFSSRCGWEVVGCPLLPPEALQVPEALQGRGLGTWKGHGHRHLGGPGEGVSRS